MTPRPEYSKLALHSFYIDGRPIVSATESEVTRWENQLALNFPEDYRDFLLHGNGGALPDDRHFVFSARGQTWRVEWFLNFSLKNKFALQPSNWKNMSPALPKFVFAICSMDDPGDIMGVFISLDRNHPGVYIIFTHYEGGPDASTERLFEDPAVVKISDSFSDFVNRLIAEAGA
jgi:hypothetical protein